MTQTDEYIKAIKAKRKLARERLIHFSTYVDPDVAQQYRSPHLRLIARYLEQAESGELWQDIPGSGKKILIITTPPRHWKSSLVAQKFPAWFVGKRMNGKKPRPHQVIIVSYAAMLAERNSRAVLETIKDNKKFAQVFEKAKISKTKQSASEWWLQGENNPCGVAVGVGGGLVGQGADVLIMDDVVKGIKEAYSPEIRKQQWEWWLNNARTRLNPDGFCVIIMTRWHPHDLAGRIITEAQNAPGTERVVILRLPALAETQKQRLKAARAGLPIDPDDPLGRRPGEALWPEMVSAAEHRATARLAPKTHASQNQGVPLPDGGNLAGRDHIQVLAVEPAKDIIWLWCSDFAITQKQQAPKSGDPDFTTLGRLGLWTPEGNKKDARLVLAELHMGQLNPVQAKAMIKGALLGSNCKRLVSGQANIDRLYLDGLRGDADLIGYSFRNLKPSEMLGNKVANAQPWLELVYSGRFYVVRGAWNDTFFESIELFPHGGHDDIEDMVSVGTLALGLSQKSKKVTSSKVNFYGS